MLRARSEAIAIDFAAHGSLAFAGTTGDYRKSGGASRLGFAKLPPMKATAKTIDRPATDIATRVDAIDWTQATADLDAQGCAVLKGLLSPDECDAHRRALSRRHSISAAGS